MTRLEVDVRHRIGDFDLRARFAVGSGLTVLFGPSGAGKTLTLGIVAGLVRPVAGKVELDEEVLVDTESGVWRPPRYRRIGMVFQDALLLPHRNVLDNVALAVRGARGRSQRRALARSWLERVGAVELAAQRPLALSGGQRQRVALARALVGRPRLLLLDEPLAALDLPVRKRLRALVRELVDTEQLAAVFVTHDREEAAELVSTLVLARPGDLTTVREGSDAQGALDAGGARDD